MLRTAAILSIVLVFFACTPKTDLKEASQEKESPVVSSLAEAGLPCFKCHKPEKFAADEKGKFSHTKHLGFGVHCNQCHLIKPHKEMALNKDTCNRCHKMTSFAFTASGLPVNFSHQQHSKRHGCRECHPAPFQMRKGATRITMDEMYKGGTCGRCHDGKKAFASNNCSKCHDLSAIKKDIVYPSSTMSAAVFSHGTHTAMFECVNCHTSIFKFKKGGSGMKMDDLYENRFCGKCHNGEAAFAVSECRNCHK